MPKSHLAMAKAALPPPPPLLGGGGSIAAASSAGIIKKKRKATRIANGNGGGDEPSVKKKKKSMMNLVNVTSSSSQPLSSTPSSQLAATAAKFLTKKKATDAPNKNGPGGYESSTGSAGYGGGGDGSSTSGGGLTPPPAGTAAVGTDAAHVLLLLGLPRGFSDEAVLQKQFERCAPLQVKLLKDWASGHKRGAASLALASGAAVKRALEPGMTTLVDGSKIRVCDVSRSDAEEGGFNGSTSAEMKATLQRLLSKAAGAAPSLAPSELQAARHLLLTCADEEAAKTAIEEFVAVARSGTPKSPGQLLLSSLLRHRARSGGLVWLGRVRGKPLPTAPAERLRKLMDELDWSSMPADGKLRGNMADSSFKLGLSTKAWGKQNGPYLPFAFKPGMGVWDAASVTKKHKQLWEAASALIQAVDPKYPWTSIAFNRNFRGSKHRDDKDAAHQVAMAFGEYEGGELRVHGQEGVTDVDTRNRFVRFDGRFEHEVMPYSGGPRYSVIYFMLSPPWSVDPSSLEQS